jgi:myo-inositol 2-dehydrogenase/D-chiro-inositol 1-dehydrogenase
MKVLILGNGAEEQAWAHWLLANEEQRIVAVFPGFAEPSLVGLPSARDLDDALARAGIDAVIVGGPIEGRGEYLRRAAAEGLAIICLHPTGADSEAYYQVSLSRAETGAIIVPDLALRLHPGVDALRLAMTSGEMGAFRGLRLEIPSEGEAIDLARVVFARAVDVVRALLGDIEAVTATGDPPGEQPDLELVVQLRAAESRRAEIRAWSGGAGELARLSLLGSNGSLTFEFDPRLESHGRWIRRTMPQSNDVTELDPWDPHAAIFSLMVASCARRTVADLPSPNLHDATRAMELAEATVRSLRRGRTVDLHYEPISEEATFKSVMTSTGCMLLLAILFVLPIALGGPPLGFYWTIYIAYLILPLLLIFVMIQFLRLAVRPSTGAADALPSDEHTNDTYSSRS